MRHHIGAPQVSNAVIAVSFLIAFTAFILSWVGAVAPAWVTFVNKSDVWYTVGLFTACKSNTCVYAWTASSPIWTVTANGTAVQTGWYYYSNTPSTVVAAQFFYIFGLLVNMFTFCFWAAGSGGAVVSQIVPTIFYTIGFGCGADFFLSAEDNNAVLAFNTGYGFACAAAGMTLAWIANFMLMGDLMYQERSGALRIERDVEMKNSESTEAVNPADAYNLS